ncbi:MAG: VCBS repeat-containing protein, partial [Candidatus Acidiferrum sp.]
MRRRDFIVSAYAAGLFAAMDPSKMLARTGSDPGFHLTNVTTAAGIQFQHNSGAYGGKLLPETLGSGCAFLDYDADGWQDILLINGMDWPGHQHQRSTLKLYKNNRNGTFTDVTKAAGLD